MAVAEKRAVLPCSLTRVWDTVTSLKNVGWRSDLSRIEVVEPQKKFIEYTKQGIATVFTITCIEPMRRYEFDMENDNMAGHWAGAFAEKDGAVEAVFTEAVTAKKWNLKPFVGLYLKRQQAVYFKDLKRALGLEA